MNRDDEGSTENEAFSSKVWVNGDGKIVGRQFGITDGTDTTPVFTWKAPSEEKILHYCLSLQRMIPLSRLQEVAKQQMVF